MESTDRLIERHIKKSNRGVLFTPEDFDAYGSAGAVRVALHRLESKGVIKRVTQGFYARPKESQLVGEILPNAEEVAKAIAKRDKARIIPTGVYAMYALGLSTQIPMKLVYLTDGGARMVQVGQRTIQFKRTTPKILRIKGEISGMVIQALKAIGNGNVTDEEQQKIIDLLHREDPDHLNHDVKLAPAWIKEIMKKAQKDNV